MDIFKDEVSHTVEKIKTKIANKETLSDAEMKTLLLEVLYEEDCNESK